MYGSSGYQPHFFTQPQQRAAAAPSKFPPTPQLGLQPSLMSQSFSQPSSFSQLPPSNPGGRPGSAGAQLMRKFSGQASQQQPMSQLSDEQVFLASCQAPARPRSAFAELGNTASSQGASPRVGQKDVSAVVKDLLLEQERSRSAAASAQQKQLDSIEKRQDNILELVSAQHGDRSDQSTKLGKLLDESSCVRSALQELLQSFQLVAAGTKRTTTSDQACQTELLDPPAPLRAATGQVHRHQAAPGSGQQSAASRRLHPMVNTIAQQPAHRHSQKQSQHVPGWRQSKIVSRKQDTQLRTTPSSVPQKAPSTAAKAPADHPLGPLPDSRGQKRAACKGAVAGAAAPASGSAAKQVYAETFTSSPSTIFAYDDDTTTTSHAQLTPELPVDVDDEELARAVRERMNRHRSKRLKAARS
jgi:hypothetical protein